MLLSKRQALQTLELLFHRENTATFGKIGRGTTGPMPKINNVIPILPNCLFLVKGTVSCELTGVKSGVN